MKYMIGMILMGVLMLTGCALIDVSKRQFIVVNPGKSIDSLITELKAVPIKRKTSPKVKPKVKKRAVKKPSLKCIQGFNKVFCEVK